jgi:hypothetical protein
MRFSTIITTAALLLVTVNACKSDLDCPRGSTLTGLCLHVSYIDHCPTGMCKFKGIKDSRGECYRRGEGPPTPKLHKRAYPIDLDELETREVDEYDWE